MKRVSCVLLFLLVLVVCVAQEYRAYPNPIRKNGVLHIECTDSLLPPVIKIYNMNGMLVRKVDIGYGNRVTTISFLGLAHGVYIIWLEDYKKKKRR